jgi:predicted Ser/Thr protein kinase
MSLTKFTMEEAAKILDVDTFEIVNIVHDEQWHFESDNNGVIYFTYETLREKRPNSVILDVIEKSKVQIQREDIQKSQISLAIAYLHNQYHIKSTPRNDQEVRKSASTLEFLLQLSPAEGSFAADLIRAVKEISDNDDPYKNALERSLGFPTSIRQRAKKLLDDHVNRRTFVHAFLISKYNRDENGEELNFSETLKSYIKILKFDKTKLPHLTTLISSEEPSSIDDVLNCAGHTTNKYRFTSDLGSGVSGSTYKATHAQLQQPMAIKVYRDIPEVFHEPRILAALRRNDLKNIVQIYDAGDDIVPSGDYAIIMEYVDGDDLYKLIERGISEKEAVTYSFQLLNAIKILRKHNISHRDIHPGNVMITSEGNVKVIDFSFAMDGKNLPAKYETCYGGPHDLFSWAMVTYKMITGANFLSEERQGDGERVEYRAGIILARELMFDDNGNLNGEYVERLQDIPSFLRTDLQDALEAINPDDKLVNEIRSSFLTRHYI